MSWARLTSPSADPLTRLYHGAQTIWAHAIVYRIRGLAWADRSMRLLHLGARGSWPRVPTSCVWVIATFVALQFDCASATLFWVSNPFVLCHLLCGAATLLCSCNPFVRASSPFFSLLPRVPFIFPRVFHTYLILFGPEGRRTRSPVGPA